jgi:putative tryptophan/tyrosine transport system substrate-binding protein
VAARRTRAQQPKTYRIGLLSALAPPSDTSPFIAPLIRSLDKFGYVLGRNLVFERRGAEGKLDRLPQLAQELVESKICGGHRVSCGACSATSVRCSGSDLCGG